MERLRKREDLKLDNKIQNFSDALASVQSRIKTASDKPKLLEKLQAKESDIADALSTAQRQKDIITEQRKFSDLDEETQRESLDKIVDRLFTRKEQKEFASNFGRASFGTSMMAFGFLLAQQGFLSGVWGFDSEDREKNKEFFKRRKEGIENGSLLVPGFGRVVISESPLGKSLVFGATVYEQSQTKRKKSEGAEKPLNDIKDSLWTIATDQPFVKAGEDYLGAKKSLSERAGGLVGSFVPTLVSDVGEVLDEEPRKAKGFTNSVIRRIPVLREKAEKSTGGVSKKERGGILRRAVRAVDPVNTRSQKIYKYGRAEKESIIKSVLGGLEN